MKELSQSIRVVPVRDIPQDFSGQVSDLLPLSYRFHTNPFQLELQDASGTGGECWNLSIDHIINTSQPCRNQSSAINFLGYKKEWWSFATIPAVIIPDNSLVDEVRLSLNCLQNRFCLKRCPESHRAAPDFLTSCTFALTAACFFLFVLFCFHFFLFFCTINKPKVGGFPLPGVFRN